MCRGGFHTDQVGSVVPGPAAEPCRDTQAGLSSWARHEHPHRLGQRVCPLYPSHVSALPPVPREGMGRVFTRSQSMVRKNA